MTLLGLVLADLHSQLLSFLLDSGDRLELVHTVRLALVTHVGQLGIVWGKIHAVGGFACELQESLRAVFIACIQILSTDE